MKITTLTKDFVQRRDKGKASLNFSSRHPDPLRHLTWPWMFARAESETLFFCLTSSPSLLLRSKWKIPNPKGLKSLESNHQGVLAQDGIPGMSESENRHLAVSGNVLKLVQCGL